MNSAEVLKGRREGLLQALALVREGGTHAVLKSAMLELIAQTQELEFLASNSERHWDGSSIPSPGTYVSAMFSDGEVRSAIVAGNSIQPGTQPGQFKISISVLDAANGNRPVQFCITQLMKQSAEHAA